MSLLRQLETSSAVAWSPIRSHKDHIALASLDGLTNGDFDSSSKLSLAKVYSHLTTGEINLDDKVTCLSWGCTSRVNGIIAAGYANGSIGFYDPTLLFEGKNGEITLSNQTKHSSPINTIDFNPKESILASGSDKGEVLIWNLRDPTNPEVYTPGTTIATDSLSSIKWNSVAPHILGTSTHNGKISVWDLRNKRPVVQFTDKAGRLSRCRSINWHPTNPMVLVTASEDDKYPIIQLWNIKSSHYPVKILEGHTKGILSTSWNNYDPRFLLSTGNDNKVICWDVELGTVAEEIALETEYNFQVQWSPNLPSLFSVSSSSHLQVFSLHDIENSAQPPKWLTKTSGASFGFGGKVVTSSGCDNYQLSIQNTPASEEILNSINEFEKILHINDFEGYCESKANSNSNEERETWKFLQASVSQDKKRFLLNHLGFSEKQLEEALSKIQSSEKVHVEEVETNGDIEDKSDTTEIIEIQEKKKDVSNLFDEFGDSADPFDDFGTGSIDPYSNSSFEIEDLSKSSSDPETHQSSILELAAQVKEPFEFFTKSSTHSDQTISKLIILGNFEAAVDACFKLNRVTDALAIAVASNNHVLIKNSLDKFYSAKDNQPYIKLVSYISRNNLKQLIASANIDDWKFVLATICAHSSSNEELEDLANDLGALLEHSGRLHPASLCYIVARNSEKTTNIWLQNSSLDLKNLFDIIEKSTIFQQFSASGSKSLIEYYRRYAELLCSQGRLDIALNFLNSLGDHINSSPRAVELRNRISAAISSESGQSASFPSSNGLFTSETQPQDYFNTFEPTNFDSDNNNFAFTPSPEVTANTNNNNNNNFNFNTQEPIPAPINEPVNQFSGFSPQPQPIVAPTFPVTQQVQAQNSPTHFFPQYFNENQHNIAPTPTPTPAPAIAQGITPFFPVKEQPRDIPALEPFPDIHSQNKISPQPVVQNAPVSNTPDLVAIFKEGIDSLKSRTQKNDPLYKNLENLAGRLNTLEKPLKDKKISLTTIALLTSVAQGIGAGNIASLQNEFAEVKRIYETGSLEIPGGFYLGLKKFF